MGAGADFFAADFFAATLFVTTFLTATFVRAVVLALFLAAFFDVGCSGACCAAWNAAHRFFVASEIAFLPAALIFRRLRLVGFGVAAELAPRAPVRAAISGLQWGRDQLIAELPEIPRSPDRPGMLQWGRDQLIAEFPRTQQLYVKRNGFNGAAIN